MVAKHVLKRLAGAMHYQSIIKAVTSIVCCTATARSCCRVYATKLLSHFTARFEPFGQKVPEQPAAAAAPAGPEDVGSSSGSSSDDDAHQIKQQQQQQQQQQQGVATLVAAAAEAAAATHIA
jgi:hypothetical protein